MFFLKSACLARALVLGSAIVVTAPSVSLQNTTGLTTIGSYAHADITASQAQDFVQNISEKMINLITSDLPDSQKQADLMGFLNEYASIDQIARFAIGADWRELSSEQKNSYQNAFRTFVARTYVSRFKEYSGETIQVTRVLDAGQKGQLVQTQIDRSNGQAINVEWLVSDRSGALKVEDLRVEGVSLAITQRDEFSAMLAARQNNYDLFISDLAKKAVSQIDPV